MFITTEITEPERERKTLEYDDITRGLFRMWAKKGDKDPEHRHLHGATVFLDAPAILILEHKKFPANRGSLWAYEKHFLRSYLYEPLPKDTTASAHFTQLSNF